MKTTTKLLKRKAIATNKELQALNSMRMNPDLADAIAFYLTQAHLAEPQRIQLRAVLAVLSHATLNKKLLASL